MSTSAIRAVRSVFVFMLIGLGALGCLDLTELTGVDDGTGRNAAAAPCPNNGFKCIHSLNTQGYTCVQVPDEPPSVTVVYACIMNGGDIRAVERTLEDLSAWESSRLPDGSRRQLCHAKTRCTR